MQSSRLAVGWPRDTGIRPMELIARVPFFQKDLSTFEFGHASRREHCSFHAGGISDANLGLLVFEETFQIRAALYYGSRPLL
jgi:hypothetical protein